MVNYQLVLSTFLIAGVGCAIIYFPFRNFLFSAETKSSINKIIRSNKKSNYLVDTSEKTLLKIGAKPYRMILMLNLAVISSVIAILPEMEVVLCPGGRYIDSSKQFDGNDDCPNGEDENTVDPLEKMDLDFDHSVNYYMANWIIILACTGPLLLSFIFPKLVFELCPIYELSKFDGSLNRFGKAKNRLFEPIIGTGSLIATGQLVIQQAWESSSIPQITVLLTFLITGAICISVGQMLIILLSKKSLKKHADEIVLIFLHLKIALPVSIHWDNPSNLIQDASIPEKYETIKPEIVEKYNLEQTRQKLL